MGHEQRPRRETMGSRPIQWHKVEVSPLKRIMLRTMPELSGQLAGVVNVFDPWARDRGEFYSLEWKPQAAAASDESFN